MGGIIKGKSVDVPRRNFRAGEVLFRENEKSACFFIVKKGIVEVYQRHGTPQAVLLATLEAGRVLGEFAGADGGPWTATAIAKTDVEVGAVRSDILKLQVKQCPLWFQAVIFELVRRLRNTEELLVNQGRENAPSRKK